MINATMTCLTLKKLNKSLMVGRETSIQRKNSSFDLFYGLILLVDICKLLFVVGLLIFTDFSGADTIVTQ